MKNFNLTQIETELKKRLDYPYKWGRKQNNYFDKQTNFIYNTFLFDDLLIELDKRFKSDSEYDKYFNYAMNRWYNFWSAQAVEQIFCTFPDVKPARDSKDRLVDFTIKGAAFDHKTSTYPKNFPMEIKEAIKNTPVLIKWFYKNQSQQQRKHLKNRLFIVLYNSSGLHWKLKAEIAWLKEKIDHYLLGFHPDFLMKFSFEEGETIISDVIWAVK
jgi:hypothetical protein